jgi:hypothetical protein
MAKPESTCGRLQSDKAPPGSLRRFVLGEGDNNEAQEPQEFDADEGNELLQDPLAQFLLLRGEFPTTATDLLIRLDASIGPDHPLAAASQRSFVVSEGSQVLRDQSGDANVSATLRFIVTRGAESPDGPDLIVSVSGPDSSSVEVMAWDPVNRGFNFYRTAEPDGAWIWAGNSRHALEAPTRGLGPFEAHPSGTFLMKELKRPWVHWHSPDAVMDRRDFRSGDLRAEHDWFLRKRGAYELEESVAKPAVVRWNRERVEKIAGSGKLENPAPIFEQIVGAPADRLPRPTVNLTSSMTRWSQALTGVDVALPQTFFVDVDSLSGLLGLPRPPLLSVAGDRYVRTALAEGIHLEDGSFNENRDSHFAFVVPERAFEDVDLLSQLLARNLLVTPRLALCLLLVDFVNPVFSDERASLLEHIEDFAHDAIDAETYGTALGDHIASRADSASPATARFAELWALSEDQLQAEALDQLKAYYDALERRVNTDDGWRDYLRLACSRRAAHEDLLIHEFPLVLPQSDADPNLRMHPDGGVR